MGHLPGEVFLADRCAAPVLSFLLLPGTRSVGSLSLYAEVLFVFQNPPKATTSKRSREPWPSHTPSSFPRPAFYYQGWKSQILAFPASPAIRGGHWTRFWPMRPEGERLGGPLGNILLGRREIREVLPGALFPYIVA